MKYYKIYFRKLAKDGEWERRGTIKMFMVRDPLSIDTFLNHSINDKAKMEVGFKVYNKFGEQASCGFPLDLGYPHALSNALTNLEEFVTRISNLFWNDQTDKPIRCPVCGTEIVTVSQYWDNNMKIECKKCEHVSRVCPEEGIREKKK